MFAVFGLMVWARPAVFAAFRRVVETAGAARGALTLHLAGLVLLALPLFDGCTGEELATLARHINFAEIGRGERLCSEGEPADTMYFVVSGRLEVLKRTTRGDCRVVARAGRGSTVGEMALFDRSPRSATVIARQPSVVILLTRKGFDLLTARHPGLGLTLMRNILRLLSLNMRLTTSRLADQLPG